jgi:hypothetical protein
VYGELAVIDECDYNARQCLAFACGRWPDRHDLVGDHTPTCASGEEVFAVDAIGYRRVLDGA